MMNTAKRKAAYPLGLHVRWQINPNGGRKRLCPSNTNGISRRPNMLVSYKPIQQVRGHHAALGMCRDENGIRGVKIGHPFLVGLEVGVQPATGEDVKSHEPASKSLKRIINLLINAMLDRPITLKRHHCDLLELHPMRLLKVLKRLNSHVHKFRARSCRLCRKKNGGQQKKKTLNIGEQRRNELTSPMTVRIIVPTSPQSETLQSSKGKKPN